MDLSFLGNVQIETPLEAPKNRTVSTPIEGDIRIWKSGKIAYSDDFKVRAGEKWLDLFSSKRWLQMPKDVPTVMFININEEEKPSKADIKGEGTCVAIKTQLFTEAAEVLGFDPELSFVDLSLDTTPVKVPIALIPKVVQRGAEKGSDTYVKRENITLYALTIDESLYCSSDTAEDTTEEPVTDVAEEIGEEAAEEETTPNFE